MLEWCPTISFAIGSVFCFVFPFRACCNLSEDCIYTSGFFCRSERRTNKPRTDRSAHNAERRCQGGGRDRRRTGYGENKAGVLWQLRVRCTPVGNRAHVHQLREGRTRWHEDRHVFSFFSVSLSLRLSLCASFLLLCMILCMLSMICYSLCHISCMFFRVVLCTVACRCSSLWGSNGGSVCVCVCVCVLVLPIIAGCFLVRRIFFKRFVSHLHYFAWICWAVNLCCFLLVWMLVGFGVCL